MYDGSASVIDGQPIIIAAGLTPNTTSVFCHPRATPTNLSDPLLVDWAWDEEPLYCGNETNGLTPFDAPSSAWKTALGQWMYVDGQGNVYVSDDGLGPGHWRGALPAGGRQFPGGAVSDFFELPRVCDGCDDVEASVADWKMYNGSDLACADVAGENQKYPKDTTDAAGIALCQASCAGLLDFGGRETQTATANLWAGNRKPQTFDLDRKPAESERGVWSWSRNGGLAF